MGESRTGVGWRAVRLELLLSLLQHCQPCCSRPARVQAARTPFWSPLNRPIHASLLSALHGMGYCRVKMIFEHPAQLSVLPRNALGRSPFQNCSDISP